MGNEIIFSSARELSERVHKKDVSAREVMEAHLAQIEKVNPQVNAIVSMLAPEKALEQAIDKDRDLASGTKPGPLFGFPHAVKDLCDAAGFPTTNGSPIFKDNIATQDALIVQRIRRAGGDHHRQDECARIRARIAYLQPRLRPAATTPTT